MMNRYSQAIAVCLLVLNFIPGAAVAGVFDLADLQVTPSPAQARSIQLEGVEKVVDYDVSPAGPDVAALVKSKDGDHSLVFWQIGAQEITLGWKAAAGFVPRAIAWHPRARCLFVMGSQGTQYHIMRLDEGMNGWSARSIFSSPNELRRIVMGPSPFVVEDDSKQPKQRYRLFLGMKNPDGTTFRIVSITEEGKRFYQVIGPSNTFTHFKDSYADPSNLEAASALPMAFHRAGDELIWEDRQHDFHCAQYDSKYWGKSTTPLVGGMLKGGSVTPTPNGLGWLHWQPSSPGIGLFLVATKKEERLATDMQFVATPSSVPDGRGVVGLTKSSDGYALNYVPIAVPLADVVNAWMFCNSQQDINLLENHLGLFRPLNYSQLYELYHSETGYCCKSFYNHTQTTRPYLVTTDIFWELFAAAYEGLMIVQEREQAIPAFWKFVSSANQYYKRTTAQSHWKPVFEALSDLRSKNWQNPESARINAAQDRQYSKTLGVEVDYGELKPRGHYASSTEMQDYFKAFRYLTSVYGRMNDPKRKEIMSELKALPPEVQNEALAWVVSYHGFIAPSRSFLVWKEGAAAQTAHTRHPSPIPTLFPLSWGFDNEVLYSTVYHPHLPAAEQVYGPGGERLSPSGLDLASVLGNGLAESLLKTEYEKYPGLLHVVANLRKSFVSNNKAFREGENLYDRWISALAFQWADDVDSPDGGKDEKIWRAKRLQTGLASWATLRHAAVLVNERSDAQCGEGGFEDIVLCPPRGYVEPDPRTFAAIAGLFDTAIKHVAENILKEPDNKGLVGSNLQSLRQGIIRRFKETAAKARLFQSMAEKQIRGETLTEEEYEEILYVGRVAEHHFVIFKSLGSKDYALSLPDPMSKIADVAGGEFAPFLMAAVGKPAEWDHVVPYFGRRQIVKGSVYSYYEFVSPHLLNDENWRGMTDSQARPAWIQPFFTEEKPKEAPCPAGNRYSF
jgi:hypothetical protein